MQTSFYPLADSSYKRWQPIEAGAREPEPHEQRLLDAVERAIDAGCFYNTDVNAAVKADFGAYLRPEDAARNHSGVQGGDFEYEVYHARRVLDARRAAKALSDAEAELNLQPGTHLGSLVFSSDFKLNTGCTVAAIDGHDVKITGKRGRYIVTITTNALSIKHAMDRAFGRGKRKTATLGA